MLDLRLEYFAYSFGSIFITEAGCILPNDGWSGAHQRQGFSRGRGCLQFATLTQFGSAELSIKVQPYNSDSRFERVIEVPFHALSQTVEVGSIENASEPITIKVEPGHYKVVISQQLLAEDEIGAGRERIEILFEKLTQPLEKSKILVCDSALNPPSVLLES